MRTLNAIEQLEELLGLLSALVRDPQLAASVRQIVTQRREPSPEGFCQCQAPAADPFWEEWDGTCRRCGDIVLLNGDEGLVE